MIVYKMGPFCRLLLVLLWSALALVGCAKKEKPSSLNILTIQVEDVPLEYSEASVAEGRKVFVRHCMQCHLSDGAGAVGANLKDDHWVLGSTPPELVQVIAAGTTQGMPGWSGVLSLEEIGHVTSWVIANNPTLRERYFP